MLVFAPREFEARVQLNYSSCAACALARRKSSRSSGARSASGHPLLSPDVDVEVSTMYIVSARRTRLLRR